MRLTSARQPVYTSTPASHANGGSFTSKPTHALRDRLLVDVICGAPKVSEIHDYIHDLINWQHLQSYCIQQAKLSYLSIIQSSFSDFTFSEMLLLHKATCRGTSEIFPWSYGDKSMDSASYSFPKFYNHQIFENLQVKIQKPTARILECCSLLNVSGFFSGSHPSSFTC